MAGRFDDIDRMAGELERIPISDGAIEAGNGDGLVDRADDLAAELLLQRQIALDVIGMVMRSQDMADGPATPIGGFQDRICLRRVDRCRQSGFGIMDQDAVIVGTADKNL